MYTIKRCWRRCQWGFCMDMGGVLWSVGGIAECKGKWGYCGVKWREMGGDWGITARTDTRRDLQISKSHPGSPRSRGSQPRPRGNL